MPSCHWVACITPELPEIIVHDTVSASMPSTERLASVVFPIMSGFSNVGYRNRLDDDQTKECEQASGLLPAAAPADHCRAAAR